MNDTVYKVVAAQWKDSQIVLTSANLVTEPEYCLTYVPGAKTFPAMEGSYLYAFDDLATALAYTAGAAAILKPLVQLWVYEAKARIVATNPSCTYISRLDKFWEEHWHAYEHQFWPTCPAWEHSVWCEWIQLGKKLKGAEPLNPLESSQSS